MSATLVVRNVIVSAAVTGTAYLAFLGHRSDYLGHFLAGFGATLLLLLVLALVRKRAIGWDGIAITLVSIAIGFVTESSIFRFAFFDPVDFCNQSIGACIACACVLGARLERRIVRQLGIAAAVLLVGGFVFAFI